jgi:hypothetical protein
MNAMRLLKPIFLGFFILTISCDRVELRIADKDKYTLAQFSPKNLSIIGIAEQKMISEHASFFYSFGCPTISETKETYVINFKTCLENTTSFQYTVVVDKKTEKAIDFQVR